MPLLTDADFASIRSALAVLLVHSYARTPEAAGAEDAWGDAAAAAGSTASGLPCRFAWQDRFVRSAAGTATISTPTLTVPADDPLRVGDLVSNVTDQQGMVLLAGPARVETVDPQAGLGASLQKTATLRAADVRGA